MALVKFTAGFGLQNYNLGGNQDFRNDEVKEVPDDQAKYLIQTFPKNFKAVTAPENKAVKPGANK